MPRDPVIVTCAVTGSIHTPSMSMALPYTPEDIADQAIAAAEAGAAIVHIHARDPEDGRPASDPILFRQIISRIQSQCDSIVNVSTGGGQVMSVEERVRAAHTLAPEICSLNMGTMNFGIFPLARKDQQWKFDWERPHLENSDDFVFRNTFRDIHGIYVNLNEIGTKIEFECYDVGHVRTLAWFIDQKIIETPVFIQFVLGVLGGIEASPEALLALKATADRLIGAENYRFSVASASRDQLSLAALSALLGGHVRVGLEDNLYIAPRVLATSNAEQVTKVCRILQDLGHTIASPQQARAVLTPTAASAPSLSS